jgi:hypothetical protein
LYRLGAIGGGKASSAEFNPAAVSIVKVVGMKRLSV